MSSQHPKISIIMPTYNRAGYILETIRSVLEQSCKDWELIIIDDGSDDNTGELLESLMDSRIRHIKRPHSGNVARLKNEAIILSGGKFIAFIDSDDLWAPSKLEKQIALLEDNKDAGFCLTGGYNFKIGGEPLDHFYKQRSGSRSGDLFIPYFNSEVSGFTQALMVRRECVQMINGFNEDGMFNDADLIIRLASRFKGIIWYEPLVYRRIHDTNYIHSAWVESYREGIRIIRSNSKALPRKVVDNALFRLYINFGEKYLRCKQSRKALGRFLLAWKHKPLSMAPAKKMAKALLHK